VIPITTPNQPPIQRVMTALPYLLANNPMAPQVLHNKQCTNQQQMQNNTPGALPAIHKAHRIPVLPIFIKIPKVPTKPIPVPTPTSTNNVTKPCCSHHLKNLTLPHFHNVRFISKEVINSFITNDLSNSSPAFTPLKLCPKYTTTSNLKHYALAMVHPVTGKHIKSYRKLMQDPATLDVWMHTFGKDFGRMAQGNTKTGTTGTDAIFVMEPRNVPDIPKDQPPTYAKVVITYHPQKEDPY
jgi:hypothetical protein